MTGEQDDSGTTQTAVSEMDIEQLREEYKEVREEVDPYAPYESQEDARDRREELWQALRSRADVQPPKCSHCEGRRWSQQAGDPCVCRDCGREASASKENEVHEAWNRIVEGVENGE